MNFQLKLWHCLTLGQIPHDKQKQNKASCQIFKGKSYTRMTNRTVSELLRIMGTHPHIPNPTGYKTAYFSATLSCYVNKSQPTMARTNNGTMGLIWTSQKKMPKIKYIYSVNEMEEQIENQLLHPFILSIHTFISARSRPPAVCA